MKTVINTTGKTVNKRNVNKANNVSKMAKTKAINLLNEVKKQADKETKEQEKETKKKERLESLKQKTLEQGNFKRVVIGTNSIFKTNFVSLGYLLKIVSNEQETILEEQKKNSDFNEFDAIKLNSIFNIIKLARKNSDLYKAIQDLKGIRTKKDNYCIFFLLRSINTNLNELNKLVQLQNWK
jgi:hypothetical protein